MEEDKTKSNIISMKNFIDSVKKGEIPKQDERLEFLIETIERAGQMLHKTIELRDIKNGYDFAKTVTSEKDLTSRVTQMILATNEIIENYPGAILPERIEHMLEISPMLDKQCKQDMIDTLIATGDYEIFIAGKGGINDKR
tara:strand:+ start:1545 stop:1967 length:423 start_codon:yes stop_codon:yes gene_type:complete